mmetsp:Transcript_96456/g.223634  ORF Transcript_96456/g.223634 Transcript_96456/m.223634 type:complete len:672 (-) Transcript_96456:116-2131(-)
MSAPHGESCSEPVIIGAALEVSTSLHRVEMGPTVEALTIDHAVEDVFGSKGPKLGAFAGAVLVGVPRCQRVLMVLCGAGKSGLALSAFLPLFAHEAYEPAHCQDPRETWRLPDRISVAFEWALCCGDEWKLAEVGSAFFVGNAVGAALGGALSDRYGRRPVVVTAGFLHGLCVLLSSAAPGWRTYLLLRFLCGVFSLAVLTSTYTLAVEWMPSHWRPSLSAFLFFCTAFGECLLAFMALALAFRFSSGWRALTAASGSIILGAALLQYLALSESPRWLYANDKAREAADVLRRAARQNAKWRYSQCAPPEHFTKTAAVLSGRGLHFPEAKPAVDGGAPLPADNHTSVGLLLQSTLNVSTWVMALLWLAGAMSYYGVSLAGDVLRQGMSLYASALLCGLAEIPSALLAAWMLQQPRLGRRGSTALLFGIAGCNLVALPWIDDSFKAFFAISSKGFASAAFDCLYVFTSEVFETRVRGAAMGLCSMAARFGSMSAPQALVLLSSEEWAMLVFGTVSGVAALACQGLLPDTEHVEPEQQVHSSLKVAHASPKNSYKSPKNSCKSPKNSYKSPKHCAELRSQPYLCCETDPELELEVILTEDGEDAKGDTFAGSISDHQAHQTDDQQVHGTRVWAGEGALVPHSWALEEPSQHGDKVPNGGGSAGANGDWSHVLL